MPFGGLLTTGLIGAGSSILGGLFGSSAAKKAAALQQQAAKEGIATTSASTDAQKQLNAMLTSQGQGRADDLAHEAIASNNANTANSNSNYSPYIASGSVAQGQLSSLLQRPNQGFSFNIQDDPGYAFRLQQGQDALRKAAAAQGQNGSGGLLKALTQYSQNYASGEYQNAFSNYQTQLQNLFNQAGIGLNASNSISSNNNALNSLNTSTLNNDAGLNTSLQTSLLNSDTGLTEAQNGTDANLITGGANAGAAGAVGSANAWTGALNGVAGTANQAFLLNLLSQKNNPAQGNV